MSLLKAAASSRAKAGYARRRSLGEVVPSPVARKGKMVSRMASAEEIMWRDMVRNGVSPEKAREVIAQKASEVVPMRIVSVIKAVPDQGVDRWSSPLYV